MSKQRALFLAWQDIKKTRQWFPAGRLDVEMPRSPCRFRYMRGAERARKDTGFEQLVDFPDFRQDYNASELFPHGREHQPSAPTRRATLPN